MGLLGDVITSQANFIQYAVEQGLAFRAYDRITVPASSSVYWSVITPESKSAILFDRSISSDKPNTIYEPKAGAAITGYGSALPVYPLNSLYPRASGMNIRRVTSLSGEGTAFDLAIIRGGETPGNHYVGGQITGDDIRIFPLGVEFLLKITNAALDPADVLIYLKWFEITPEVLHVP